MTDRTVMGLIVTATVKVAVTYRPMTSADVISLISPGVDSKPIIPDDKVVDQSPGILPDRA